MQSDHREESDLAQLLAQNNSLKGDLQEAKNEIVNTLTTKEGFKKALTEFENSPAAMTVAPEGDVAEGAGKVISAIGKDAKLVKYAEEAGQSVQKGLDHLVEPMGDAAAVAITRVLAGKRPQSDTVDRVFLIIEFSFDSPEAIVNQADRKPKTALFVLASLDQEALSTEH